MACSVRCRPVGGGGEEDGDDVRFLPKHGESDSYVDPALLPPSEEPESYVDPALLPPMAESSGDEL